ncbi:UDP-N-acetylglucosamine transferase subunit ALG13 homolog [Diachasma alloeum]|uniref:UDP-N-acetylglucosamine transferase subunit ALG13 homolog n=1 Tax=Diachasma alloeum TaxID=454923 RepID=UPI00073810C2|nr:UDP-N-acetylglucosamine transferase subunit ALG13 homolog [Diachasma alloeum]
MSKKVFVTVGTTKFDKLIETITKDEVLKELSRRGYDHLILQIGASTIDPNCTPRCGMKKVEFFRLKPSIQEYMRSADLVISHAGAGSCLEALEAGRHLIVVTNELLMDNHQLELAEQLGKDNHLYHCTCEDLLETLRVMDLGRLVPLVGDNSEKIARTIDRLMGV